MHKSVEVGGKAMHGDVVKRLNLPLVFVLLPGVVALAGLLLYAGEVAPLIRDALHGQFGGLAWPWDAKIWGRIILLFLGPVAVAGTVSWKWKPEPRYLRIVALGLTVAWAVIPLVTIIALTRFSRGHATVAARPTGFDGAAMVRLIKQYKPGALPKGYGSYTTSFLPVGRNTDGSWAAQALTGQLAKALADSHTFATIVVGGPGEAFTAIHAALQTLKGRKVPNVQIIVLTTADIPSADRDLAREIGVDLQVRH